MPRHRPPEKNAASSPAEGKEAGKSSGSPSRVRARLFRARLNKEEYTPVYNHTQRSRNEHQKPQRDTRSRRTTEKDGDHQREALTGRKERRRGEGRRVARRPMFRAEQLTDGDRQRRRGPRLHALTIRQTAAGPDQNSQRRRISPNPGAKVGEMNENLQKNVTFLYILGQYGKESTPAAGVFPAKSGGNGRHRHPLTTTGTT